VLLFVASEAEYQARSLGANDFVGGIAGGMTGGVAQAYATMGFCTCMKTVEITKHKMAAAGVKPPGTFATFMDIYRKEGIRGINRGVNAVAIRQTTNWGSRFGLSRLAESAIRKVTGLALPDGAGVYRLAALPGWMHRYAPYLRTVLTGLKLALPLVTPGLGAVAGATLPAQARSGIELTCKLLDHLPDNLEVDAEGMKPSRGAGGTQNPDFRELRKALLALDPEFGGLRERELPESRGIVYLCTQHRAALRYPAR